MIDNPELIARQMELI